MTRAFSSSRLLVASHNQGKVREIRDLLVPFKVEVLSAGDLDLPEPSEDADTFIGNAKIKALASATTTGIPALSDDSGLCVSALDGAPGVYSARYAGPQKDFSGAMTRIHQEIGSNPDRRAWFVCALCLAWPDEHVELFEGRVDGTIVWPPRGENGFGFDPFFVPDGFDTTFAEMEPIKKHAMSHRARAFNLLVRACFALR